MQPHLLICASTSQACIPGAQERWCHVCTAALWVSAAMLTEVDEGRAAPTCQSCSPDLIRQAGRAVIHPNQVGELRATGLLGTARRFVGIANLAKRQHRFPFN